MSQPVYPGPPRGANGMPMHPNRTGNDAFEGNRTWSPRGNHLGGPPPLPVRGMPPHAPPPHAHMVAGGYFGPKTGSPQNMRPPYPHGMAGPVNPGSLGPSVAVLPPNAAYFAGPNYPGHRNSAGGYLPQHPHHEMNLGYNQLRNATPWEAPVPAPTSAPTAPVPAPAPIPAQALPAAQAQTSAQPAQPAHKGNTESTSAIRRDGEQIETTSSSSSPEGEDPPSLKTSPSAESDSQPKGEGGKSTPPPTLDAASILCSMKTFAKPTEATTGKPKPDSPPSAPSSSAGPPLYHQDWTPPMPDRLSIPEDQKELNSLHCFVRAQCIELFATPIGKYDPYPPLPPLPLPGINTPAADDNDDESNDESTSSPSPTKTPPGSEGKENAPNEPHAEASKELSKDLKAEAPKESQAEPPKEPQADLPKDSQAEIAQEPQAEAPQGAETPMEPKTEPSKDPHAESDSPSPTFLRVGLRCVHCAMIQRESQNRNKNGGPPVLRGNAPMGTFYPKTLAEIYNLVNRWQRVHFRKCKNVPPPVRHQFDDLKRNDKSRGKREYWITSAKKLGLVDDEKGGRGIRYMPPPPPPPPLPPMFLPMAPMAPLPPMNLPPPPMNGPYYM